MNDNQFDKLLNIETTESQYGFPALTHHHRYEPTPYAALEQFFTTHPLSKGDRFVDMGCGLGRVSFYVYKQFDIDTVGIEVNEDYYKAVLINKQQYAKKTKMKKSTLEFQCELAQKYIVDPRDNVFFFFNPFSVQIFMRVMGNIMRSLEGTYRSIKLILYYPSLDYIQYLQNETSFELVAEVPIQPFCKHDLNERILLYQLQ